MKLLSSPRERDRESTMYLHIAITAGLQLLHGHLGAGISANLGGFGQQIIAIKPPQCGVDLLFGQIAL